MNKDERKVEDKLINMTIYNLPESLVRDFKTFTRLNCRSHYNEALQLLIKTYKEKESYLYIINEVSNLKQEVNKLKESLAVIENEEDDDVGVRTFGR